MSVFSLCSGQSFGLAASFFFFLKVDVSVCSLCSGQSFDLVASVFFLKVDESVCTLCSGQSFDLVASFFLRLMSLSSLCVQDKALIWLLFFVF